MKGKKYGIIVSVITMIISLVLILLFNWCDKEKYELLLNIIIGVLGSSVVTLIISISDYIVAKREALEEYFSQVYKIIIAFGKIKYVHITDRVLESAKYKTECELKKCFGAKTSTMDSIMEYYDENNYWDNYCEKLSSEEKEQIILEQIEKEDMTYLTSARSIAILKQVNNNILELEKNINNNMPIDMIELDIKNILVKYTINKL